MGQLLVASGNAAKTLEAVDQALYLIPLSVSLLVERLASPLMELAVTLRGTAASCFLRWKQRLQSLPLLIG
jgi:hypothetical protein